ncbi:hypothetical protein A6S26_16885 [Nostoc sp. ATCC 43529]|nr:hypothetical protein A6S26_16885 [Nostoc sp. ATCC 43529]
MNLKILLFFITQAQQDFSALNINRNRLLFANMLANSSAAVDCCRDVINCVLTCKYIESADSGNFTPNSIHHLEGNKRWQY